MIEISRIHSHFWHVQQISVRTLIGRSPLSLSWASASRAAGARPTRTRGRPPWRPRALLLCGGGLLTVSNFVSAHALCLLILWRGGERLDGRGLRAAVGIELLDADWCGGARRWLLLAGGTSRILLLAHWATTLFNKNSETGKDQSHWHSYEHEIFCSPVADRPYKGHHGLRIRCHDVSDPHVDSNGLGYRIDQYHGNE